MLGPLLFEPLPQVRVWGGTALASRLGRRLPSSGGPWGESWEVVDRAEAQSRVRCGPQAGRTLGELRLEHPAALLGPGWASERPFPILVKWLDCRERLSLQVHPPAAVASSLGGEPKTEHWYVADASADAGLYVGLRAGVGRAEFESALAAGGLETLVHRVAVRPGDAIFIPSGWIHAIDGGNLILEIQQNSDTTYRVYDWGRIGLDGRPRTLHVQESLASIDWTAVEPRPRRAVELSSPGVVLAEAPEFRLRRWPLAPGEVLRFPAGEARIASLIEGRLRVVAEGAPPLEADRADSVVLPAEAAVRLEADGGPAVVLVTDGFSRPAPR